MTDLNLNVFTGSTGNVNNSSRPSAEISMLHVADGKGNELSVLNMQINGGKNGFDPTRGPFGAFKDGLNDFNNFNKLLNKFKPDCKNTKKDDKKNDNNFFKQLGQLMGAMMILNLLSQLGGGLGNLGNLFNLANLFNNNNNNNNLFS